MIGFSIMMWFVSFVVLMVAISLLRGNISSIHGKVFDATEVGYGKQLGKPCLIISVGVFISGLVAFLIESNIAIVCALAVLLVVIAISVIWFALIQKRYRS